MSRHKKPEDWGANVPASDWPDVLITEVRRNPGALASRRTIRTIRRWQAEASDTSDLVTQAEAIARLRALANALLQVDEDIPTTMLRPPQEPEVEMTGRIAANPVGLGSDSLEAALQSSDRTQIKPSRPTPRRSPSRERAVLQPTPPRLGVAQPESAGEHATRASSDFAEATRHLAERPKRPAASGATNKRDERDDAGPTQRASSDEANIINTPEVVEAYVEPSYSNFADASEHPTRAAPLPGLPK